MDIREKLIALLDIHCDYAGHVDCKDDCTRCLADHLIANGVTVQEWIPVTEKLPKPFDYVLVHMPRESPQPTVREGWISRAGIWHSALYNREMDEVTHWMPMSEPPKEV